MSLELSFQTMCVILCPSSECLKILPKWNSLGSYDPDGQLPRPGRMTPWLIDVAIILLIIGFLYESDSTM